MIRYVFWIELEDGQEIRWSNLTSRHAEAMYKQTGLHLPLNVKSFGWGEQ